MKHLSLGPHGGRRNDKTAAVSGELLGNLYDQGREIAVFKPYDPNGYTANAPFVMNAMPWKRHTLFTDFNSGLWAITLEKVKR